MDDKIKHNQLEKLAMNIVYQLDDDSGLSVDWRQANNDKRINFVLSILKQARLEALRQCLTILEQDKYIEYTYYTLRTIQDLITQTEND